MSQTIQPAKSGKLRQSLRPMTARVSDEGHRTATPLELLFDLVSVIAIAAAASGLHHAISEHHIATGLIAFAMAFFSIWWAWMGFTWFASSYDNDDLIYRLAVFVMIAGSLCIAGGVGALFKGNLPYLALGGYVIMRVAHVGLLLRAGWHNHHLKPQTRMQAIGISLVQVLWVTSFFTVSAEYFTLAFFSLVVLELLVPAITSKFGDTPWHKGHIAERYGLLTIIVLGESLLAVTHALQKIGSDKIEPLALAALIGGGLITMFAMWWLYFGEKRFRALDSHASTFLWGYGHLIIFAAIAAYGAGLAVGLDVISDHAKIDQFTANAALTVPSAGFLIGIWLVHEQYSAGAMMKYVVYPILILLVLASGYLPMTAVWIALLLVIASVLRAMLALPVTDPAEH